ncbi:TonB protein C-terminal [Reichenbachiella faecimaris]|uniref:TonB protein C-terminal n=1 Tax=Reichenbachiella faecimaris TaxID=692418 RepID=A0A1W2G8D0_REIFA|nr:energy transducer TonB [Reichenbachiella faecimaris]SMD32939.1 TonB protein C-terminal [Reichenbachiella faecimaris]
MSLFQKLPISLVAIKISIFITFLLIQGASFAQPTTTKYYNAVGQEVEKAQAYYLAIGHIPLGKDHFVGKVTEKFISSNRTKAKKTFDQAGIQEGVGIEYYENGQVKEKYQLKNGHVFGGYVLWFPNGVKALEREYTGYSTATEINHKTYNAWDSLGNQVVKNGMGDLIEYHNNLSISARGKIYKGMRSGIWEGFYSNGNLFYTEKYKGGELVSGTSTKLDSSKYTYTQINTLPSPKMGFPKYYEKLTKAMNYPKSAKKIGLQGTVHIAYTIDHMGEVSHYYIIKGLSPDCNQEALRIFEEIPVEWNPGTSRGNPQSYILSLPVSFKL